MHCSVTPTAQTAAHCKHAHDCTAVCHDIHLFILFQYNLDVLTQLNYHALYFSTDTAYKQGQLTTRHTNDNSVRNTQRLNRATTFSGTINSHTFPQHFMYSSKRLHFAFTHAMYIIIVCYQYTLC